MKCSAVIDGKVSAVINKRQYVLAAILLTVGIIGLVAYIALGVIFDEGWTEILLIFAVPTGLGIFIALFVKRTVRNAAKTVFVNNYEFFENNFTVNTILNGDDRGSVKYYYSDIKKSIELKDYILLYLNAATALIIDKNTLSGQENDELKNILISGGLKLKKRRI